MRLDDHRFSDNVRDQRGQSFGGGGFGGGGGGMFGMLFGLVLSRFGIGGVLILALGYCALTMMGGGGGGGTGAVAPHQQSAARSGAAGAGAAGGSEAQQACSKDEVSAFSCRVLASTEDTWGPIFAQRGERYQPAMFTFYGGRGQSGCGAAQSAMGPFYCPSDNSIYLDTSFFQELQTRFRAAGDFAQAYVIAHEVGHHIQQLTGVLDRARREQRRLSAAQGNAVQVRVELQADCYAGVWAGRNRERMEPGDLEEGMRAAEAIGDDTLQRQAQGRVSPESFTHGTAAQRMAWLRRGIESADPAACDTFSGAV
jgi:predicted metalloprotease